MRDAGEIWFSGAEGAKAINSQAKGPYSNGTLERPLCGAQEVTGFSGILSGKSDRGQLFVGFCLFFLQAGDN